MLAFPPDITFIIQLGSFFVLLYLLNRLLFAPFAAVLAERSRRTEGDQALAREERDKALQLGQQIDHALAEAKANAHAEVDELRKQTKDEEADLLLATRNESAARLAELRAAIERAQSEARARLREDARMLADQMVDVVLGTGAGS